MAHWSQSAALQCLWSYDPWQYITIYYFFEPSIKKYPKVEKKIKDIVVAGMNTNPGGVPT